MKLLQLTDDSLVDGGKAGWWIIVTDNHEYRLSEPIESLEEADILLNIKRLSKPILNMTQSQLKRYQTYVTRGSKLEESISIPVSNAIEERLQHLEISNIDNADNALGM